MSLKNILVAYNGSESANTALLHAASLAQGTGKVTAFLAHSGHEIINSRAEWMPAKAREIIAQANAGIVSEIRSRFESTAPSLGLGDRLHIEERTGRVDTLLSEYARVFDMLVIGRNATEDVDEHLVLHPDRIALLSGRPILIVPQHHTGPARHDRAVIAWDGGRAAARALSDSLALLEDQGSVTVLTIGDISPAIPASAVRRHLERHSIDAKVEHIDADPGVARALVAYCKSQQPGLLVMGAYEHSKFREDFMGGVTARVLQTVPVPVLMSH